MYCHECNYYGPLGRCRHPRVARPDRNYFEKACENFEQQEPTQTETPPPTMEEKPTTKVCKECGRELPLDAFMRNPHGVTSICKECAEKKKAAKKAYKDKEKQSQEEFDLLTRAKFPGHKEGINTPGKCAPKPEEILKDYTDSDLVSELRRRGYAGTLTKTSTLEV